MDNIIVYLVLLKDYFNYLFQKYDDPDPRAVDRKRQILMIAKRAAESKKPIYRMTKEERLHPERW